MAWFSLNSKSIIKNRIPGKICMYNRRMAKTQTFECPSCGGPLEYDGGDDLTVTCPFCNSSVIVPEELREDDPQVVFVQTAPAYRRASGSRIGIVVALFIILVLGAVITGVVFLAGIGTVSTSIGGITTQIGPIVSKDTPVPTPAFANVAFTFGEEGTGAGYFDDARHIGVDGQGNIYVGEYGNSRIQVFDPEGNFISLFIVEGDSYLTGMTVDRQGIVYVVYGSEVLRYEGATGQFLGLLEYAGGWGFDDVVATADGGLVAAWYKSHDNIIRFDTQGNVLFTIEDAISGQSGDSELNMKVAVDGLGNIYALGTFNEAVFKYSPEGQFLNRFGGEGSEPGQFRAARAIAVDGQGRVYVADIKGIQVFDSEGRYLNLIKVDGPAFGIAFNDQNEIFVAAKDKVIKYTLQD